MGSLADAVGNKVAALHDRGGPRAHFDVDAIRAGGRFSDAELVAAAAARDAGFEIAVFAQQLRGIARVTLLDLRRYGVSAEDPQAMKTRCTEWAAQLPSATTPST